MKVLAYTSPARGHLYPIVPVLAELQRRAHRVSLWALPSEVPAMRELGIDAHPTAAAIGQIELDDYKGRTRMTKGTRALATFLARAEHELVDLQDAIAKVKPDAVLIDINCWGAAVAAELAGVPWAMFSPYLLPLPSRQAPPYGLGLAPARSRLGSARDALAYPLARAIIDRTVMPGVDALRRRQGLPQLRRFRELLSQPQLLLVLTVEGFEYPRGDWPENVRFVGAVNWSPTDPLDATDQMADPLVLVTCSTERQLDERLIEVALEALPPAGISVLATTGDVHDPDRFAAPSGSRVVGFASHEPILARAACVICHGGMGITQKALAAGVPVVVVPFGRDQFETAQRVKAAGAGVHLSARRLTAPRLLEAVEQALRLRPGAERIGRAYAAAGGAMAAADAIEALALTGEGAPEARR
ncbi:MAG TPA: nucleotide disphospho-sugar-binding domain-containing protein [Solirubrobacteraceae bacterium]|jgi:MGT family glycosyltransferase